MDCERSNINVLVVDHDMWHLTLLANILMAWQYKVQAVNDAHQALAILRDSQSSIDLIIIELYILGMNGFDFQKFIQDQFQIPIIVISDDEKPNLISKSLELGARHFIRKPGGAEDFKDIWKYAIEAERKKIESLSVRSEELQETSTEHPKTKKKYCKRKGIDEYQGGESKVVKKPKFVWTTYFHNLFLLAIKQIGLNKAAPKKILEIMNIPNLTRENVASHLQKYRISLRDVAEENIFEGVSQRNNIDIPYVENGLAFQDVNQVRLGKSKLETSDSVDNNLFPKSLVHQETNSFINGASTGFSSYGVGQGLMASSFSSIGNDPFNHINHGMQNWSSTSILPQNVSCGARNSNPFGIQINKESEIVPIGTMNNEGFNSVDLRGDMVNSNISGLNVGDQNANTNFRPLMYENFGLVQGEFGSCSDSDVRGGSMFQTSLVNNEGNVFENRDFPLQTLDVNAKEFDNGSCSGSDVRGGSIFQTSLVNNEGNVFENRDLPMQKLDGKGMEFDNGTTSMNEIERNQMSVISDFLMADDMDLLNEMNENHDASGFNLESNLFHYFQDVLPHDKVVGDDISPSSAISLPQNSSQLQENEVFSNGEPCDKFMEGKLSKESTSTSEQEFDKDFIEALRS